jgi:hypothetical protein
LTRGPARGKGSRHLRVAPECGCLSGNNLRVAPERGRSVAAALRQPGSASCLCLAAWLWACAMLSSLPLGREEGRPMPGPAPPAAGLGGLLLVFTAGSSRRWPWLRGVRPTLAGPMLAEVQPVGEHGNSRPARGRARRGG